MKKQDLDAFEAKIRKGLEAAETFINRLAEEMKEKTPGMPLGVYRIEAMRGGTDVVRMSLWQIEQQRKQLENEAAA